MSDEEVLGSEHRRRVLETRVLLLSPRVGCWEGRLKIPPDLVDLRIAGQAIEAATARDNGITTPYTVMLTDKWPVDVAGMPWKKRFSRVQRIKERALQAYSIPFSAAGARIVPMSRAKQFFHDLIGLTLGKLQADLRRLEAAGSSAAAAHLRERIQTEHAGAAAASASLPLFDPAREEQSFAYQWRMTADEFCNDLADAPGAFGMRGDSDLPRNWGVLRQIRERMEPRAAWDAVQSRVPRTAAQMRQKFYCEIMPVELAGSGGEMTQVTADVLEAYDAVVRDACRRAVESAIETIVERPREELAEALAELRDVIERDGRVTERSFRPVYAALQKLRGFEFAANADLLAAMTNLENSMRQTAPAQLSSATAAASGFSAAINAVMQEARDATRAEADIENFGRPLRSLLI